MALGKMGVTFLTCFRKRGVPRKGGWGVGWGGGGGSFRKGGVRTLEETMAGTPSYYLELLDKLQKRMCRTVDPSLAAYLEPLAHPRNLASLSLFYRYYFGRCSSELAQLVPLPYSRGKCTRYSDSLHDFSVTIPRCS